VRPQTVIRETVGEMVDLLFGGETMPLMKHLVEERKFSSGDIEQLRELLDRLEGGGDEQ
jgi:predicted transcriptional regulator